MSRTALLITVALVSLAGCSALGADPTREDRAVAALETTRDRLDEVESYRTDGEIHVVATSDDRTERIDVDLTGAVDVDDQRMRTNATVDGQTTTTYVVSRTVYQQCPDPWGGWGVEERERDGNWANVTTAARHLSMLESGSLYWNGTETVDGRETTLLVGHPPASALDESRNGIASDVGLGGQHVEDVTVRLWIDRETDLPIRSTIEFVVSNRGASADASMTIRYADYDEPVSIEYLTVVDGDLRELGCPGT